MSNELDDLLRQISLTDELLSQIGPIGNISTDTPTDDPVGSGPAAHDDDFDDFDALLARINDEPSSGANITDIDTDDIDTDDIGTDDIDTDDIDDIGTDIVDSEVSSAPSPAPEHDDDMWGNDLSETPAGPDTGTETDVIADHVPDNDLSDLLELLGDNPNGETVDTDLVDDSADGTERDATDGPARGVDFQPDFASFATRAGAWIIDTIITMVAVLPGAVLVVNADGALRLLGVLLAVAGFGLAAWAYASTVARTGQWIGNRITSTRVVKVASGGLLDRPHAFTRFVARELMSPVFLLGFVVALTSTSRRTFHDHVAGSVVTRPTRSSWSVDDEAV